MGKRAFQFSQGIQHNLIHARRHRTRLAVTAAARTVVELLEPRRLLTVLTPSLLQASVPAGVTATLTPHGAELSLTPTGTRSTPYYDELDPQPQLLSNGSLAPFATASPTGLMPAIVRHAYGVDQITFGTIQGDGTGQTIAIVDAYDYPTASTDLHAFDLAAGLPDPPSLTRVNETGGSTLPGTDPSGKGDDWEVEEALDVEWSHAMAPGASIVLVEATSTSDADLINAAVGYARSAPGVVAVTMSFGRSEESLDTGLDSLFTTPAGHNGVTFLASTGDSAAPGGYPAFSPNVVAVGGTTLNTNSSGGYISETGWADSGGGISVYETQPSYQTGVVTQSTTYRTIPDVSSDADPNTGVAIYDTYDFGTTDPWITVGGTSVSSPSWAGLISIADQGRTLGGGSTLDGVTKTLPKLYSIPASNYHDITVGNNGFPAGVGYDLVTGRGSPVANTLIPLLASAGPFVTTSTPVGAASTPLTTADFNFSAAMDPTSFSIASDVDSFSGPGGTNLISQISGYTWLNSNTTLQLSFAPQSTVGKYTLAIGPQILSAGGVAMDQNQNGVPGEPVADQYTTTFGYETTLLQVASTTPANGTLVSLPLTSLTVHFNEPYDPTTVSTKNLTLSLGTVTAATVVDSSTVNYTLSGITTETTVAVSLAAGALNDALGFPMLAYAGTLITDAGTRTMPASTSLSPGGSLIYQSTNNGVIGTPADTDNFTMNLDAGQTLTVVVHPTTTGLIPSVSVLSPSSTVLGTSTAAAANQDAVVQTIMASVAGTYTFVVASNGTTIGSYTVQADLNAAVESAQHGGPSDSTLATAQSLDPATRPLASGASIASVIGHLVASTNEYYSITLVAGESTSIELATLSVGTAPTLTLYDALSNTLASSVATATNVQAEIADYVAPAAGKYYIKVTGSATVDYTLTATPNAAFDLEPNGVSSPEPLNGRAVAVGSVTANGSTGAPTNPGTPYTGAHDVLGSTLSIGIAADGSFVGPTIGAKFNGIEYLRYGTFLAGFTVAVNGVDYTNDIAAPGSTAFPVTMVDFSSGTLHGIRATGTINASLGFVRTIWWYDGQSYATVSTTLTNTTSAALNTVAILDNQDPDPGGTYATSNDVIVDSYGHFVAGSVAGTGGMALASIDPRAVASAGSGFIITDPFQVINSPVDPNGASSDTSINLAFNIGTLAAGKSTTTNFAMLFGSTQTAVQATYDSIASTTVSNTPDDDYYSFALTAGQTISIQTQTPSDGPGEFSNTLNPTLDLLDPTNTLVATNDNGASDGRNALITYTALTTGTYTVRVYATAGTSGEYILDLGNGLTVGAPANVTEGMGVVNGTISTVTPPSSNLTITLLSSDPSRITVPTTVTLPAGATSVSFPITIIDDTLLNGPEAVSISASASGFFASNAIVTIHDNETAVLSVSLPASTSEGAGTVTGTITSSAAPSQNIVIQLASNLTTRLTVPATVTLLAGHTTATFTATVVDNTVIDGTQPATVTAGMDNWTPGSATINVVDNDSYIILNLPASGWEGQVLTGSVTLGGTTTSALVVNLSNNDPANLSLPATVTVPAGQSSVSFNVTLINDGLKAGSHTATAMATATGLSAGGSAIIIHDSNLAWLTFNSITGPITAGTPFTATVSAYNIVGEVIAVYSGTGALTAAGSNGSLTVSPTSVTFSAGVWTGSVTLTATDPTAKLTLTSGGQAVTSNAFVIQSGAMASLTWGAVSTPQTANVPFSETISAKDAYGNPATTFNGSVNLTGLVGSTTSATIFNGSTAYTSAISGYVETFGWAFTASVTAQVTAVRSFWGSKVSIWTDTGTLLVSQTVSGTAGVWTETSLSTPITLTAGTRYRICDYTAGTTAYYLATAPTYSWGTINGGYSVAGDGFPSGTNTYTYLVDLRANIGTFTSVPITPTTATFVSGVWTGNITVTQGLLGMHLHADDGAGHLADSANFDVITQSLSLTLPSDAEESDGTDYGVLQVSPVPTSSVVVTLTSSDTTRLTVPVSITIPAGQGSVTIPLSLIETNSLDGLEAVTITASASAYASATAVVKVHSSETATLSVALISSITKGGTALGTVTASTAPTQNITINLTSNSPGKATVPATITLLAGQTTATFTLSAVQDALLDGTQMVTIAAAVDDWTTGYKSIAILDDNGYIVLTLPTGGFEGQTLTNGGTIRLGGAVSTSLVVNLSSNDTSQVSIPASVTIPAGSSSASFNVTLVNNGVKGLSQTATITATSTGLNSNASSMVVHDSNLDHLGFAAITGPKAAGTPFTATVDAYNLANEIIPVYSGTGTLTANGLGGNLPVSPSSVTFSAGIWTGSVTLTVVDPAAVLTLVSGGLSASTGAFAVQPGALSTLVWGAVTAPQTATIPFAETITAEDASGNVETGFNGSVTLSGLVGSTTSATMLGSSSTYPDSYTGNWTDGYFFTLSSNFQITAVRSYYGTKVSIWTSSGTLLGSQAVTATAGSWTETSLAAPIQLLAGTTYFVGCYTGGGTDYYSTTAPPTPTFATFGSSYYASGDAFPTALETAYYPPVDLRGNVGTYTSAPITPTSATFVNGTWTGNITVAQVETGIHLHADDGLGQTGDSAVFNVSGIALNLNASAGNTSFYLELNSTGSTLQVWQLTSSSSTTVPTAPVTPPTATYAALSLGTITVSGNGSGNDSLILDDTNGLIQMPTGITYSGGTGATGDWLTVLLPAAGGTVSVNASTLSYGSTTINYSHLGAITVDGSSGNDTLIQNAQPGATLTFNGGTGNDTLTVNAGSFTFSGNPALGTASLTLNDNSTVNLAAGSSGIQVLNLAQLNIGSGAIAALADASSRANRSLLITTGLSIAPTGKLDLGFNDMLIHAGNLTTLNSELSSGFNNGAWTGPGIASSAAAADSTHLTALGMLLNNNGSGLPIYGSTGGLGLFDGQSPLVTDVLIKYTYYGDANLDGHVDGSDYARVDSGFLGKLTGWSNGNFNYDAAINGSDYTLIDNAFNTQGAALPDAIVADPAAMQSIQTPAPDSRVRHHDYATPAHYPVTTSQSQTAPTATPADQLDPTGQTDSTDLLDRLKIRGR